MDYQLVDVSTESDWCDYHSLRRSILWAARGLNGYDENHPDDRRTANHPLLLKLNGRSIGTTRLDEFGDGSGAIRLVTIARDMQRCGHGRVLSLLVENLARRIGLRTLRVNAAADAVGYYEKTGWKAEIWDEEERTGFASGCVQMSKEVTA